MVKGFLAIVLHAHLPYIKHEKEGELAEEWFYEAMSETYIPLLIIMERLLTKGVNFNLTINISPPLASMMGDSLLQERYLKHLEKMIELSEREMARTNSQPEFHRLAEMYNWLFKEVYHYYHEKYGNDIIAAYKKMQEQGCIEIITSAATHGYLPLMLTNEAINAQIKTGVDTYKHYFDKDPSGIWLPECGFKPGIDSILAGNNIRYYISSSHGILYATPRPRYGLFAPIYTSAGVAAFGRDTESSKQVWSANEGYPGDYNYREFYRDIGYDLDYDYIKDYLPSGIRKHTGFKYYKITGKSDWKEMYNPDIAREKAAEHAGNFLYNRQHQINHLSQILDRKPIIVSPYDAELFGHWWFEGPQWLEFLLEKIHYDQEDIKTISLSQYLEIYPKNQIAIPNESSWGYKGYHEVWLNDSNQWIYRHLHEAEFRLIALSEKYNYLKDTSSIMYRALNQLIRELLLAQSSDWAFIMKTKTMVDYAVMRTRRHLNSFFTLADEIENANINEERLTYLENNQALFPFIDFKIYQTEYKQAIRKEG